MIHIELDVNMRGVINAEAEEKIRLELRSRVLQFIFESVDAVANKNDYRFSHRDIGVTGDIITKDQA